MTAPTIPLAWQQPGTPGYAVLVCKHIEEPIEFLMAERSIDPGQEPFAYVDGREVESLMVCPDCEMALLSKSGAATIEWRGGIWPREV